MSIYKNIALGLMTAGIIATSTAASAEFSANVAMTTDYRFRGIDQNDENFAIQGGFDYSHKSGFYAGLWASSVDFQIQTVDDASAELDIYAGFGSEFGNGIGWDVGVIRYEYPGADGSLNYDFTELYGGLSYKWFSAKYSHSGNYFADSGSGNYFEVAADIELPQGFGLGLHVGHQSIEDNYMTDSPTFFGVDDYTDWKVALSKELGGFGFELAYVDTNLSKKECFPAAGVPTPGPAALGGGIDWCDSTVIFTVSKEF